MWSVVRGCLDDARSQQPLALDKWGAEDIWRLTRSECHSVEVRISVTYFWVIVNFSSMRHYNKISLLTQVVLLVDR
jgi:hypothetical protein